MPEDEEKKDEESTQETKPFENLDLREARCFGWERHNTDNGWTAKTVYAKKFGWRNADIDAIQLSLKDNVDKCYLSIASFNFVDLDDDTRWHAWFDNQKMMWKLEIQDSPNAEVSMEQLADFFKSDLMKRCAQRAADLATNAAKLFEEVLRPRLENGELLAVDEVKLAAILFFLNGDASMQGLRSCKWTSQ